MFAAPQLVGNQLTTLAERSASSFSAEQATSMLEMMREVAASGGNQSTEQRDYVHRMAELFTPQKTGDSPWD